jgi:hypothetical protein
MLAIATPSCNASGSFCVASQRPTALALCCRRIEAPDRKIERCSERNPSEVQHEQQGGSHVDRPEKRDSGDDREPDEHDIDEAKIGPVQAEEQGRPRGVKYEL